jgi:hypothetical protein
MATIQAKYEGTVHQFESVSEQMTAVEKYMDKVPGVKALMHATAS